MNHSCRSLQNSNCEWIAWIEKSNTSDSLVNLANCSQKKSKSLPSLFTQSLFAQSLFAQSLFFKDRRICLFLSLFTKEPAWANCSHRSLQKSDCERIDPNLLFFTSKLFFFMSKSLFCSFDHKKQVICSKKTNDRIPNPECISPPSSLSYSLTFFLNLTYPSLISHFLPL